MPLYRMRKQIASIKRRPGGELEKLIRQGVAGFVPGGAGVLNSIAAAPAIPKRMRSPAAFTYSLPISQSTETFKIFASALSSKSETGRF